MHSSLISKYNRRNNTIDETEGPNVFYPDHVQIWTMVQLLMEYVMLILSDSL